MFAWVFLLGSWGYSAFSERSCPKFVYLFEKKYIPPPYAFLKGKGAISVLAVIVCLKIGLRLGKKKGWFFGGWGKRISK